MATRFVFRPSLKARLKVSFEQCLINILLGTLRRLNPEHDISLKCSLRRGHQFERLNAVFGLDNAR